MRLLVLPHPLWGDDPMALMAIDTKMKQALKFRELGKGCTSSFGTGVVRVFIGEMPLGKRPLAID